jgi:hypothetical protein
VLTPAAGASYHVEAQPQPSAHRREDEAYPEGNREGNRVRGPHDGSGPLTGAEEAVPGITQAGNDVAGIVELPVYRRYVHVYVRVRVSQPHDTFRGSD